MVPKKVLSLLFWTCLQSQFLAVTMKDLWSEPFLELTEEASGKLVSVTSDANNLYLRMPEALEVDFVLGNLVAEGTVTSETCRMFINESSETIHSIFRVENGLQLQMGEQIDFEELKVGFEKYVCEFGSQPCEQGDNCEKSFVIEIMNMNDNVPRFDNTVPPTLSLNENEEFPDPILTIEGSDIDFPEELTCRFASESSPFKIEGNSGFWNVMVEGTLDFEKQRSHQLDILLIDGKDEAGVQFNETRSVYVRVLDQEDTPPTWIRFPSLISISEDTEEGTELFEVLAVDGDSLGMAIQYEIDSITNGGGGGDEDFQDILKINAEGKVLLNKSVDREALGENNIFEVTFRATEMDCSNEGTEIDICSNNDARTSLRILDTNDHEPKIDAKNTNLIIPENYNGYLLFEPEVIISDADYDTINSKFNIKIEHKDHEFLDSLTYRGSGIQSETLFIRVTSGETPYLDREKFENVTFTLKVEADSGSSMYLSSGIPKEPVTKQFTLHLEDVNDNDPTFSQDEYVIEVMEDLSNLEQVEGGYILIKDEINATDRDFSDNFGQASLQYELSSNLPIQINPFDGTVKLTGDNPFDFEATQTHNIQITVRDSVVDGSPLIGARSTTSNLKINVKDVNDETPQFDSEPAQSYCLYENNPTIWPSVPCEGKDPLVFDLKASDKDLSPKLTLEIDWTETVGRKDNREVAQEYYEGCFTIEIQEPTNDKEIVGRVEEVPDSWIDRELVDQISLVIRVADQGTVVGKNFSLLTMNIDIIDLNDSPPVFVGSDSWKFTVDEHEEGSLFQPDEQVLLQRILVSDPDLDQSFNFFIKGDDVSEGLIKIKVEDDAPNEGVLIIHREIDREALGDDGILKYELKVRDGNSNVVTKDISIPVRDLNDCTPVFDKEDGAYVFEMQEGESTKTFQVKATDQDISDPFKTVFYPYLKPDNVPFEINKTTGVISIKCPEDFVPNDTDDDCIDFEVQKSYQFTAYAADNEGSNSNVGSAYVTVNIKDDNDNDPKIDPSASKIVKPNDLNPEQPLFNYVATDADSGDNQRIDFSIRDPEDQDFPFNVSPSGELTATKFLNDPQIRHVYKFTLVATDRGEVPRKDEMQCEIEITDVNDKEPKFTFPETDNMVINVPDDLPADGPLTDMEGGPIVISATDDDIYEPFKTVSFKLLNSVDDPVTQFFKIDPNSGALTLKEAIENFELDGSQDTINLEIRAYDNAGDEDNQQKSEITLKIRPTRNIEPYFIDTAPAKISFEEGFGPIDDSITIALQEGFDENGDIFDDDICYFIPDPAMREIFDLELRTNKIKVITPLDHETDPISYNFLIITTNKCQDMPDLDNVEARSRLNLTVNVDDINDVPPEFDRDPIFEGIFVDDDQTWEKTISVVDPDEMDTRFTFEMGPIEVSLDNTGLDVIKDGAFELKSKSGPDAVIVAKFTRQESMKGYFKFNLTVSDSRETHSTTAEVKVVVIAPENKITLRFDNLPEEVDALDLEIKAVFEANFKGWLYTKDSSRPDTVVKDTIVGTLVECHFLDSEYDPVNQREAQARYEQVFRELTLGLADLSLTLKRENGFGTGDTDGAENTGGTNTATIVLIIATALLALILVCLVVTYFIRVSNLERKVKAMGFDAFGSQDSGLNRAGLKSNEGLPNTNNFASSGANPIFNIEDDIADFGNAPYRTDNPLGKNVQSVYADNGRDLDTSSVGSGDSVLIGIENQAEFKNYKGNNKGISRPQFDDSDTSLDESDFELSDLDESLQHPRGHSSNLANPSDLNDSIPPPSMDIGSSPFGGSAIGGGGGNPLYQSDDED